MKIAFVLGGFPKLSETFILSQIVFLLKSGHDVDIYAISKPKENKIHDDVIRYNLLQRTYYFSISNNVLYKLLMSLFRKPKYLIHPKKLLESCEEYCLSKKLYEKILSSKKEYDIINCHFGNIGKIAVKIKEFGKNKSKIVTTFHGYDMSSYIKKEGGNIYKPLFKEGDLFLPISKYWYKRLIELGCDKKKIKIHRMGINTKLFKFKERKISKNEKISFLTVGRLVEKKGHEYSIRAISKIAKENSNIEYNIVGDGPLKDRLKKLTKEFGVGKYVKFLGHVNDKELLQLYNKSKFFVLPSITAKSGDMEGVPVVLMEAQAMGLPIISTRHSGIPELVKDGVTGFLVDEKDHEELAKKIMFLINNPQLWREFGRKGREIVEKEFDIEKLNGDLINKFKSIL